MNSHASTTYGDYLNFTKQKHNKHYFCIVNIMNNAIDIMLYHELDVFKYLVYFF